MDIIYKENNRGIHFDDVTILLQKTTGAYEEKDPKKTEEAFLNSTFVLYALDSGRVVGTARALSDGAAWTLFTDLAVLPEYQNRGIGGALLDRLLTTFKGCELFTYTYAEAIPFFEAHGLKRSKNAFTYSGREEEALGRNLPGAEFYLPPGYRYENEFFPVVGDFPCGEKSAIRKENIRLSFAKDLERVNFQRLNELLSAAFGGGLRDEEVTRRTFEESRHVSVAFDGDYLIGCARALSDQVSQGFILNVAIDPRYQGLHLGTEIIRRLAEQMPGQNIFLNTHPGGVDFYNRKGFRRNKTAMLFPSHPDMPPEIERGFVLPKGYRFPDELVRGGERCQ